MPTGIRRSSGPKRGFTLVEIMITIAIIGIVLAIASSAWVRQRLISRQRACQENLAKIDGAKIQWAMENNSAADATPTWENLAPTDATGYLRSRPACPGEGVYTMNNISEFATCTITEPLDHNER